MSVAVVAIEYHEPEWQDTRRCLDQLEAPVFVVDRRGTGSLAKAYNKGFRLAQEHKYVWFVSNVIFEPAILPHLVQLMERTGLAAIHPQFDSDHPFLAFGEGVMTAPFVEFTAPIVRSEVFRSIPLDERMPYWGHDLDWGHRVRAAGHELAVDHDSRIEHVYVRHMKTHPVTRRRKRLRRATDADTRAVLSEMYGEQWKERLWYGASSWTATES